MAHEGAIASAVRGLQQPPYLPAIDSGTLESCWPVSEVWAATLSVCALSSVSNLGLFTAESTTACTESRGMKSTEWQRRIRRAMHKLQIARNYQQIANRTVKEAEAELRMAIECAKEPPPSDDGERTEAA